MRNSDIRIIIQWMVLILIWVYFLSASFVKLNSQSLELVDRIYGGLGPIVDIAVNNAGQRFFLFNRVYDSLVVNDIFLPIPSKDPELDSPYYWGRNYLVITDSDSIVLRRPGGTALLLNDTSLFVATTFVEDTLVTQDSIFINQASGDDGENLLLVQYDFRGNVLNTKHWRSTSRSYLSINTLVNYNSHLFICGEYTSLDEVVLDQSILLPGAANGYFARMDSGFNILNVSLIEGVLEEYFIHMSRELDHRFLIVGSSTSNHIQACNDILYNQADITSGTSFLFYILFDSTGNCINSKSIDYDYGGIISTSISEIPDTAFLVSGLYNSTYMTLDGITIHNPNNEQRGFLFKINSDGDLIDAFQLEGSKGSKRIESVIYDKMGNIWITGKCQSDTLQIGENYLYADKNNEPFGYLVRLSRNLEPNLLLKLNGDHYKLILGQDENVYLIESLLQQSDDYRLYKVISPSNFIEPLEKEKRVDIAIYPNPVINNSHLSYVLINPGNLLIERVDVYDIQGVLVHTSQRYSNQGDINFIPEKSIYVLLFLLNDGTRIAKKMVVN